MAYLALYREWRPRRFAEVIGQDHVVRTLVNALKSEKLAHAYLFCGPRGTGKTSVAKILARAVNCLGPEGGDPCGQCGQCMEIEAGMSMDVTEIDAASNRGIDEVRDLREKVKFAPSSGKVRVFIVDEVHMLTNEAFNALLKTLEEPPAHVMFILATTEPHRVPLTILSRCQRFDFHRVGDREMMDRLIKVAGGAGISVDREALELIVKASEGAVRDGLSILDQAAAYSGGRIGVDEIHSILGTVREDLLVRSARGLAGGRAGEVLGLVGEVADQGKDLRIFLRELNAHLRGEMLAATGSGGPGEEEADRLARVLHLLSGTEQDMRWSTQPRVLLEVAVVRAARILGSPGAAGGPDHVEELSARVRELEGLVARLAGRTLQDSWAPVPALDSGREPAPQPSFRPGPASGNSAPFKKGGRENSGDAPAAAAKTVPKAGDDQNRASEKNDSPVYPAYNDVGQENLVRENSGPMAADKVEANGGGGSDLLLKKIETRWNDILEVARKVCPHIAPHLAQGKGWPMEVEGNTLTIGFPRAEAYAPLAVGILDSSSNRRELSELIKSVCQADLRLRLEVSDRKPPRKAKQQKKVVRPDDVEALFGKDEEIPADGFDGFDSWADSRPGDLKK
ncbi:MAG: DNA polymerase III subunit gamma/tau [Desulfocucumaceae bacterium]